jgi:uncharacterized membrane-anchored protein
MKKVLAISFPLIGLFLWTLSLEFKQSSGKEYQVSIEGYDPRDLLSGHYLRFRLTFIPKSECRDNHSEQVCACFASTKENPNILEGIEVKSCVSAATMCPVFIEGTCSAGRFLAGIERYYIPEALAPALSTIPDGATAIVGVSGQGSAVLKDLRVGPESIEEYARKQLEQR